MLINRRLHLSNSLWGIPLCWNLFWKRVHPKYLVFFETNNWIVLAVWWYIKYSFAPNSPIFPIRLAEEETEGRSTRRGKQEIAKRYAFRANAIIVIITPTFFFFTWILHIDMFFEIDIYVFDFNDVNFNARIGNLWKQRYNRINKTHVFLGKQVLW